MAKNDQNDKNLAQNVDFPSPMRLCPKFKGPMVNLDSYLRKNLAGIGMSGSQQLSDEFKMNYDKKMYFIPKNADVKKTCGKNHQNRANFDDNLSAQSVIYSQKTSLKTGSCDETELCSPTTRPKLGEDKLEMTLKKNDDVRALSNDIHGEHSRNDDSQSLRGVHGQSNCRKIKFEVQNVVHSSPTEKIGLQGWDTD